MALKPVSAGYTSHNKVTLIRGGRDYFTLAERLIDGAQHSIHFQTYIFEADETGSRLIDALIHAAFRKVKIYLMLDGYASFDLDEAVIQRLKEAGIHFRWFRPIIKGKNYYVGRRMHHKILVVDGLDSLVGGVNVSNRYNDMPGEPAWMDFAVHTVGEVSIELFNRCVEMWSRTIWNKIGFRTGFDWRSALSPGDEANARIRINDWVRNKNQISRSYMEMFHRATEEITIMSSYFMPGRVLRKNMSQAARRGIKIRVILTAASDVGLSKAAERYLYPWLFERNIEVYEYQKTVLHGKVAVYDKQWATVGSYNVNNISAYASIELNVDVHNPVFAASVDEALGKIMSNRCNRVTPKKFDKTSSFFSRLSNRLAYETIRLLVYLFTFYFRQEAKGR